MINELINGPKLEGAAAVVWSDLLGVMDTDHKLLVGAWCLVILAGLNLMRVCVSILLEHYLGLDDRHREKRDREKQQSPSQPNNAARLQVGLVAENALDAGKLPNCRNERDSVGSRITNRCRIFGKLIKVCKQCVSFFGKFSIFAHKRVMTPNEKADLPPIEARQPRSGTEGDNGG
jgi:hypothetical protein